MNHFKNNTVQVSPHFGAREVKLIPTRVPTCSWHATACATIQISHLVGIYVNVMGPCT